MDDTPDLIIIGAGAAGLAAASEIAAHGKTILVLEARPRIGGRIDTLHDPAWPLPIERGAEFIHGRPRETADILHASTALAYDVCAGRRHHVYQHGRLQQNPDFFPQIGALLALTARVPPRGDLSFDECLQRYATRFSAREKAWARAYVQGFDAADTRQVSARWLAQARAESEKIDGERLSRIREGYGQLIAFLHTGILEARHKVELSATVTRVRWNADPVEVHATRPASPPLVFHARQALVTVPAAILALPEGQPGHIAFEPPLPPHKLRALQQTRTGPVVKVILRCREPFWENIDPDLGFFHAPGEPGDPPPVPFPTWWTTLPFRTTLLTAWAGGPAAAALSGKTPDQILSLAIAALAELLHLPRRRIQGQIARGGAAHVCDWQSEAFSRGAYSYAAVGGASAARQLARALPPRLFFAGEATHGGLTGTVPAALASAHRAAAEILHHHGPRQ